MWFYTHVHNSNHYFSYGVLLYNINNIFAVLRVDAVFQFKEIKAMYCMELGTESDDSNDLLRYLEAILGAYTYIGLIADRRMGISAAKILYNKNNAWYKQDSLVSQR